jgi:hypothetical protein
MFRTDEVMAESYTLFGRQIQEMSAAITDFLFADF